MGDQIVLNDCVTAHDYFRDAPANNKIIVTKGYTK